jgi:hypothetical protein
LFVFWVFWFFLVFRFHPDPFSVFNKDERIDCWLWFVVGFILD